MVGLERMYAQLEMAYENLSNRYSELAREKREVEQRLMEQEAENIELRAWNDKLFEEVIKMPVRPMTLEERFAEWEREHGPIEGGIDLSPEFDIDVMSKDFNKFAEFANRIDEAKNAVKNHFTTQYLQKPIIKDEPVNWKGEKK